MRSWAALVWLLGLGCSEARPVEPGPRMGVHPAGILDPADPDFHGVVAQMVGFGLARCAKCHGADFAGGLSGVTCLSCHKRGPTACDTCHGQPPASGAHATHAARYGCVACHIVPAAYTDDHLHAPPARLIFDGWDAQTRTCSVGCHGSAKPIWTADPAQAACGSCHALPPPSHADARCAVCHPPAEAPTHVNGRVDLGDGSRGCTACHGQPPQTGAHVAHGSAEHGLRGPIACDECHRVPSQVTDPGHIDHPPPAVLTFGVLARTRGALPAWDEAMGRCANTYCHGSAQPTWTGIDQAACGTCHGIPPVDGVHWATIRLTDCATCHPQTIDPSGALIVTNGQSTHINGVVDVR